MFGQKYKRPQLSLDVFWQGEIWTDKRGNIERIAEMDERRVRVLLDYIWLHRKHFERADASRMLGIGLLSPDAYFDIPWDVEEKLCTQTPEEWYDQLPLIEALRDRLNEIKEEQRVAAARAALADVLFPDYLPTQQGAT